MTRLERKALTGNESAKDSGRTAIEQRDVVLDSARRYLRFLAVEDIPRLPADVLRDRLGRCRALLDAVVETSRSGEPLARTVDEAAAALGVSPLTVYRLVNNGDLAAYRISRRLIRIDETALRSYLADRSVGRGDVTSSDIAEQYILPAWQLLLAYLPARSLPAWARHWTATLRIVMILTSLDDRCRCVNARPAAVIVTP